MKIFMWIQSDEGGSVLVMGGETDTKPQSILWALSLLEHWLKAHSQAPEASGKRGLRIYIWTESSTWSF